MTHELPWLKAKREKRYGVYRAWLIVLAPIEVLGLALQLAYKGFRTGWADGCANIREEWRQNHD